MANKIMLAVDYGASSGRVMVGAYDGEKLSVEEAHRFSNDPVILEKKNGSTMYWDFLRLFHEMKTGLLKAKQYGPAESVGVDTWGVDYGLLDKSGSLLSNPIHYRDQRTEGMLKKAFEQISRERFYEITGNQFMEINTVFQLMADIEQRSTLLEQAEHMLLMPDLFNYYLSGVMAGEYTIASTTQMLDAREKKWSGEVLSKLGIPENILAPMVMPGTRLGPLRNNLLRELEMKPIDVIAVAGHDTQSAMAAVPAETDDFIFLSCGTWSLFGTELDMPIINKCSYDYNITNEGGCGGKTSFLKNIIGLWLIQESRRQWIREGKEYSFGQLETMAKAATPFSSFIDPDAPEFVPAGDVPERIRQYCLRTGQPIPDGIGGIVRCIDESLAMKYRSALDEIRDCTGKSYQAIHLVGGGAQSALLCQMTANACGMPVIAGPIETTVYGNLAMQLLAAGEVSDLKEIRSMIRNSEPIKIYEPQDVEQWNEAYEKYLKK
jgi:rhamnulokinase